MNNYNDDRPANYQKFLYGSGGVAIIIAALALLISAINLGRGLSTPLIIVIFQVAITILGVSVTILVTYLLVEWAYVTIIKRIDTLELKYDKKLSQLNRRIPTFLTVLILVCDALQLIADKAFSGDTMATISISLFLLLIFWVANELATAQKKAIRVFGFILYFLGIASLPTTALIYHQWNIQELWSFILQLDGKTIVLLGLTAILFLFVPILTLKVKHEDMN